MPGVRHSQCRSDKAEALLPLSRSNTLGGKKKGEAKKRGQSTLSPFFRAVAAQAAFEIRLSDDRRLVLDVFLPGVAKCLADFLQLTFQAATEHRHI